MILTTSFYDMNQKLLKTPSCDLLSRLGPESDYLASNYVTNFDLGTFELADSMLFLDQLPWRLINLLTKRCLHAGLVFNEF